MSKFQQRPNIPRLRPPTLKASLPSNSEKFMNLSILGKNMNSPVDTDNFKLRESIRNFSLDDGPRGNQGYSRVLLQIFGYSGHGKSCFINSCKYVLEEGEDFIEHAKVADSEAKPETMERKSYNLTKYITMVDNRGCTTMSSFQTAEIYTQLGNFLPIGKRVDWMKNYTDMMTRVENADLNPNYSDFIVPILIYSATKSLDEGDKELKTFMENCVKLTGVVPIVVITHKTSGDFFKTEKTFRLMGAENVISIENYTKENHIKIQGRTRDVLTVLHRALEDVKYRLGEKLRNPREDWVQRKKFLLEYFHKVEMEKKEEELRADEVKRRVVDERRREEEKRKRKEERRREEEERRREEEERRREEEIRNAEKCCCLIL